MELFGEGVRECELEEVLLGVVVVERVDEGRAREAGVFHCFHNYFRQYYKSVHSLWNILEPNPKKGSAVSLLP